MRDSWTDERLDDFRGEVNRRFDGVDMRFGTVERRMEEGFAEMNARFDQMNARFDQMNARFDSMQRMLLQLVGGLAIALIGVLLTVML